MTRIENSDDQGLEGRLGFVYLGTAGGGVIADLREDLVCEELKEFLTKDPLAEERLKGAEDEAKNRHPGARGKQSHVFWWPH